jgi:hypothetical protein
MLIVSRPQKMMGLRVVDVYFPDRIELGRRDADIGVMLQSAVPSPGANPFYTLLIDLEEGCEELMAKMSKNTRYKILRASDRDPVEVDLYREPTADQLLRFAEFFDEFAKSSGLPPCKRARLQALRECRGLSLGQIKDRNDELLAIHMNVVDQDLRRARLLYSASHYRQVDDSAFRNLIGRANRLLHWREICWFRELGFKLYDLGGIGGPDASEQQLRIREFKQGLGGQQCIEYNSVIGWTLLGKMAVAIRKLLERGGL